MSMQINKGFSLIELMVVVAIVAVLAAVAIPTYTEYTFRAKTEELLLASAAGQAAVTDYISSTQSSDCTSMPQSFSYPTTSVLTSAIIDYENEYEYGPCAVIVSSNDAAFGGNGQNPAIYAVATIIAPGNISWTLYSNGSPYVPNSISNWE